MQQINEYKNPGRFFISPYFAAMVAYFIFLVALFFPEKYYRHLIREQNYISFDPASFLFVTTCVFFFFIGTLFVSQISRRIITKNSPDVCKVLRISVTKFILLPVIISIIFSFMSIKLLLANNPNLIMYLLLGDGANLKRELVLANTMAQAAQFSICVALWATVQYNHYKHELRLFKRFFILLFIGVLSAICMANAIIKMARFEMMPLLLGFMVIILNQKYKKVGNKTIVFYMLISFFALIAVFGVFSFLRGFDSSDDVVRSIVGYTITSYNHMAALLNGKLRYLYPGDGYYLAVFLQYIPLVGDMFTSSVLGWVNPEMVRSKEFIDTAAASLNESYIWITVFGYVFVTASYLTPFFMLIYGCVAQLSWSSFKRGNPLGIVFYPWMFFCIMFWLGSNILAQQQTISVFAAYIFLQMYSALFIKKIREY